jgi:hypothetical protein
MTARRTKSRFASRPLNGQSASLPAHDHPAIMSGRTIFPGTVRAARSSDRWALTRGEHSRKIGDVILKSKWKGFPVFTLTLEERATCPEQYARRFCASLGLLMTASIGSMVRIEGARVFGRNNPSHPYRSEVHLFRDRQGVINLNAEIPDGASRIAYDHATTASSIFTAFTRRAVN